MKDSEIRGLILKYYYERRREGWCLPKANDLGEGLPISDRDVLHVADQLAEHGFLEWRKRGSHGDISSAMGKINAAGIDVVEGSVQSQIQVELVQHKTININGSQNVVVGENNNVTQSARDLISLIENSTGSPEQKQEAKGLLQKFLEHPLVSSVAGGALGLLG